MGWKMNKRIGTRVGYCDWWSDIIIRIETKPVSTTVTDLTYLHRAKRQ